VTVWLKWRIRKRPERLLVPEKMPLTRKRPKKETLTDGDV